MLINPDPNKNTRVAVTESGDQDTFTLVLTSQPTADVIINMQSKDTTEAVINPDSIIFTSANWDAPQTITVMGVDDAVLDGDQVFKVNIQRVISDDANYDRLDPADVKVENIDNE